MVTISSLPLGAARFARCYFEAKATTKTTMSTEDQKARARALFKKEEKQQQDRAALTEYQSQQEAVREKTERLRAQRLARDAAEATTPVAAVAEAEAPINAKVTNGVVPAVRLHRVKGRPSPKKR
jgi:hypothetical protein